MTLKQLFIWLCLLLFGAWSLSACGFKPLYGNNTQAIERNASILVLPVTDNAKDYRFNQILHNDLRDRLNPTGMPTDPAYKLKVRITQVVGSIGGTIRSGATRKYVEIRASYDLIDARSDRNLYTTTALSRVRFDTYALNYDSTPALDQAKRNAFAQIADEITRSITLRLAKL